MITTQSIILAVCNTIIIISALISILWNRSQTEDATKPRFVDMLKATAAFCVFVLVMVLQVYSLECMVRGQCHVWSWLVAIFAILSTLGYLGLYLYLAKVFTKVTDTVDTKFVDWKLKMPASTII